LIEQLQPSASGVTAEQSEVDAALGFMDPQWQGNATANFSAVVSGGYFSWPCFLNSATVLDKPAPVFIMALYLSV
jgi:hypothetical protein